MICIANATGVHYHLHTMAQPKSYLLIALITGRNTAKISSYYQQDGVDYSVNKLRVDIGDEIAWQVQVQLGNGTRTMPPYSLQFNNFNNHSLPNSAFFGQATLDVTGGGTSPALKVLEVQDRIKYSIQIPSIGFVLDPDMQSGPDNSAAGGAVPDVTISWNTETNHVSVNGVAWGRAPIPVRLDEQVEFTATGGTNFSITFQPNSNNWQTPFDYSPASPTLMPDSDTPLTIVRKVADNSGGDTNALFPFFGTITTLDGGAFPSPTLVLQLTV